MLRFLFHIADFNLKKDGQIVILANNIIENNQIYFIYYLKEFLTKNIYLQNIHTLWMVLLAIF